MTRDDATMSLLEHLEELRSRIIVIAIAVLVAAIAGFFLADPIITLLRAPLEDSGAELIQTNVGEAFSVRLTLALMCGIAFAMPVILYEIWAFVTPGLTRPERRLVWPLLGAAADPVRGGRRARVPLHPAGGRLPPRLLGGGRPTAAGPRRLHRLRDDLPAGLRPRPPVPGHPLPAGSRRHPQLRLPRRAAGAT